MKVEWRSTVLVKLFPLGCLGISNVDLIVADFTKTLIATRQEYEEFVTAEYSPQEKSTENFYLGSCDRK